MFDGYQNYEMSVFVVVIKGAIIYMKQIYFPSIAPKACGTALNFLEMSTHSAFVDGTFTKAYAIRSTIALQQLLIIYDTEFNEILLKDWKDSPFAK